MSAHTPGPWTVNQEAPFDYYVRIFSGSRYIASVDNSDETMEERLANARLIAAAPELLEALKELNCWFTSQMDSLLSRRIQALIDKAEGRE